MSTKLLEEWKFDAPNSKGKVQETPLNLLYNVEPKEVERAGGYLSKTLNENTPGKQGGQCILVGAPSGQGKSLITMMEIHKSLEEGKKVVYYTTEMSAESSQNRLAEIHGCKTVEEKYEYTQSLGEQYGIIDDDLLIPVIHKLAATTDVDEIYIDYLDSSMLNAGGQEKATILKQVLRALREIAQTYNKFIWVCAQARKDEFGYYFSECRELINAATLAIIMYKQKDIDYSEYEIIKIRDGVDYAPKGTVVHFKTKSPFNQTLYKELGYVLNGEYTVVDGEYKEFE